MLDDIYVAKKRVNGQVYGFVGFFECLQCDHLRVWAKVARFDRMVSVEKDRVKQTIG